MPPQTSQRCRPVPSHSLHVPIVIPAINHLPLPPQRLQEIDLWPRHLGHKNLFGIALLSKQLAEMRRTPQLAEWLGNSFYLSVSLSKVGTVHRNIEGH
jgi:hypothetical protein